MNSKSPLVPKTTDFLLKLNDVKTINCGTRTRHFYCLVLMELRKSENRIFHKKYCLIGIQKLEFSGLAK